MQLNRISKNPLLTWLCLLAGIVSVTAASVAILLLVPDSLGHLTAEYVTSNAFSFDKWEIKTKDALVSFPQGGIAVEAYERGRLAAYLVWGNAQLEIQKPDADAESEPILSDMQLTALFLSESELLQARSQVCMQRIEDVETCQQAAAWFRRERRLPSIQLFGHNREYAPTAGTARLIFFDDIGQRVVYQEGLRTRLTGPTQLSFWSRPGQLYPPLTHRLAALLVTTCLVLLLCAATYFATLGTATPVAHRQLPPLRISLPMALLYALALGLIKRYELGSLIQIVTHVLLIASSAYWLRLNGADVGRRLRQRQTLSYLGLGLFLGSLAVFLGALNRPTGWLTTTPWAAATVVITGLTAALAQGMLWHLLILQSLRQKKTAWQALLLTATAQGGLSVLTACIGAASTLPLLNALLVALQGFWLGFVYLRTQDLAASLACIAIMTILPQLLAF